MISVSSQLAAALAAPANRPIDLYELYLDSGTLYYADQQITWGGHTYQAKVKSRSAIKRYDGGQFDSVTVTFGNVDTTLAQVLLGNEIEGRTLIVRKVDRTVAGDSIVLFNGPMDRPGRITETEASLTAKQVLGSIDFDAPARLFGVFCPWEFKGYECGYAGAAESCDKSWSNCAALARTSRFGGFRFIPHSGTYQYAEVQTKRAWYSLALFKRKKTVWKSATFEAVDDTPYDVPLPIVYGRVQMAGITIQHEDQGGATKALIAFCVGAIENIYYLRANNTLISDYTLHQGDLGGNSGQGVDPRFSGSYPYSLLAYAGVSIPSEVSNVDSAPAVTGVISGRKVAVFGAGGVFQGSFWSDNPVWCVRDFLSIPLAQGGMGIPDGMFDDAVNAAEAAYCDELVVDVTNDQKIYNPPGLPETLAYKRYRSTGVDGGDPEVDGPYSDYVPGVDDDTSRSPTQVDVKRFTMNVAIAKQEKAVDILFKKLLPSFRGYLTFSKDGKIQIRSERPGIRSVVASDAAAESPVILCSHPEQWAPGDLVLASSLTVNAELLTVAQVLADRLMFTSDTTSPHAAGQELLRVDMAFDDANMLGSIEYPLSDRQPSTNRVTIKYVDSPAGFEARELRVNDYEHQAKVHRVNNQEVDGAAIDSYFQAWRVAQWTRAKARDLGKFVALRADIRATRLEIGDLVAVTAAEAGLEVVPFRVVELAYEENDEVSVVGQLYATEVYDDTAPQVTAVVPAVFPEPPAIAPPGDVQPFSGHPFGLTVSADGLTVTVEGEYDPPAGIGTFCGVVAHLEDPDGGLVVALANPYDYDGDGTAEPGTSGRRGSFKLVYPQPTASGRDARLYLTSRSQTYSKPLVFHGDAGESPSRIVTLPQAAPPESAPDPIGPSACALTIIESGDAFGLRTSWTPANPYGGTVGYEREVRYFSDSAGTTPISDWIPLGGFNGPSETTRDSGLWPKPTVTTYAQLRVRAYNADSDPTSWVLSATPLPQIPNSQGESIPSPAAPTSPTIQVLDQGGNFGLRTGWTAPGELGSTVGYDREAIYYSDAAGTTPISGWIPLGSVGTDVTTADSGWWPRPESTQYVRLRVRGFNGMDAKSAWVQSAVAAVSPLAAPNAPTSPTLTVLDQGGNFGLRTGWTAPGELGSTVGYDREVRYSSDSSGLNAVSDWIPLGSVGTDVATVDSGWWPRPAAAQYARLRVRATNETGDPSAWVQSGTPLPLVSPPPDGSIPARRLTDIGRRLSVQSGSLAFEDADTSNILPNGSFESDLKDWNQYWGTAAAVRTGSDAASGGKYCRLTGGLSGMKSGMLPVQEGDAYTAVSTVRAVAGTVYGMFLWISFFDANHDDTGIYSAQGITPDLAASWTKLEHGFAVPGGHGIRYATVLVVIVGEAPQTEQWDVDNVRLAKQVAASQVDVAQFFDGSEEIAYNATSKRFEVVGVDLQKAVNFSDQFTINQGTQVFELAAVDAGIVVAGRLQVGGGTKRVSSIKIFDTSSPTPQLIGWDGDDRVTTDNPNGSGLVGSWRKLLLIGGSGPLAPKAGTTSDGSFFINDGTFGLTRTETSGATYVVAINSAFTAGYNASFTGLQISRLAASNHRSVLINRGLVAFSPLGYAVASLVSYNGDPAGGDGGSFWGDVRVTDAAGNLAGELDGFTGLVTGRAGFRTFSSNAWRTGATVWNMPIWQNWYACWDNGILTYFGPNFRTS